MHLSKSVESSHSYLIALDISKGELYVDGLDNDALKHYRQRLNVIDGVDPYSSVAYMDIIIYLVYSSSVNTLEELHAYKTLLESVCVWLGAWNLHISPWRHSGVQSTG